jgi:tRNA 2-selenouridine synthase
MKTGYHIYIDTPLEMRSNLLVDEYIRNKHSVDQLIKGMQYIKKHMSNDDVKQIIENLENEKFHVVAKELMKNYYDPMYLHRSNTYNYLATFVVNNFDETAQAIKKLYKNKIEPLK